MTTAQDKEVEAQVNQGLTEQLGEPIASFKCSKWPRLALQLMDHQQYGVLRHCPRPSLQRVAKLCAKTLDGYHAAADEWLAAENESELDVFGLRSASNSMMVSREICSSELGWHAAHAMIEPGPGWRATSMMTAMRMAAVAYAARNDTIPVNDQHAYDKTKDYAEYLMHIRDMLPQLAGPGRNIPSMEF